MRTDIGLDPGKVYDLPIYVWALVLIGAIGIPAATTVTAATVAVLGSGLVISGLLARAGVYRQDAGETVPCFLVAVAGTLIALLLATRIPLIARILSDPSSTEEARR